MTLGPKVWLYPTASPRGWLKLAPEPKPEGRSWLASTSLSVSLKTSVPVLPRTKTVSFWVITKSMRAS